MIIVVNKDSLIAEIRTRITHSRFTCEKDIGIIVCEDWEELFSWIQDVAVETVDNCAEEMSEEDLDEELNSKEFTCLNCRKIVEPNVVCTGYSLTWATDYDQDGNLVMLLDCGYEVGEEWDGENLECPECGYWEGIGIPGARYDLDNSTGKIRRRN